LHGTYFGETNSSIVSQKEDIPEMIETLTEEVPPLENTDSDGKESPHVDDEASTNETETEVKLNEVNDSFKKFFSSIGLKFTLKKDSDTIPEVSPKKEEGEAQCVGHTPELVDDTLEANIDEAPNNVVADSPVEPADDSTSHPTMTDLTFEEFHNETTKEQTTEMIESKEEITPEEVAQAEGEAPPTPIPIVEEMSPFKRFFLTGKIHKQVKQAMKQPKEEPKEEVMEEVKEEPKTEPKEEVNEEPKDETIPVIEGKQNENEVQETGTDSLMAETSNVPELMMTETNEAKHLDSQEKAKSQGSPVQEEQSPSLGFHTVISNEAELLSSQEKAKNQGSPLRKLLYGAGLKKLSRKRRGKKSDELTRSGEHVTEDLLSSTESEEYQRGEHPASSTEELAAEQVKMSALLGSSHESDSDVTSDGERKKDGTWTSFKKLMTPTRCPKRSSESEDELAHEGPKQSEGEQVLERFTEETKKKVEISVSWEALLCGSAKRRGRKTSDSEEEAPMNEGETLSEPGNTAESPLDSSQEGGYEHLTSSPEEAVSPLGSEGGSTWKSLKKLVTSNRKAKTEEASKVSSPEQVASDSEITKEESSFSLKKLIPGRKKQKHGGKQEPISSDEADKGVGSDDEEDSETPAVVPMSEFDAEDLGEKHIILTEPDVSRLVTESAQAKDTVEQLAPSTSPTATKDFEDLTEFISKHQQLSDIPEEGVIEETIATQVSTAEEATRDDTIAEDLIELTSEAVTAPEPLDDESTEMVSAVSQLTEESPKTSGNTTPVPAEYELKDTEVLLHEAVETINRTPTLSLVITKDPHLEAVTISVYPQILQTPKETEATVLTAHEKSDAVTICTGEESHQIDAVDESPVTHVVECPLEVRKVVPTELAPEETEESGAARITTDEVHKAGDESIAIMHIEIEKDQQTELVNELEEVRPVLVATVNSEEGVAQVEGKAIAEDTPQPDTERLEVSVTDKLVFTQAFMEVTLKEEKEEFMDVSEDSADMENEPVAETITCDVQDVATAMPDVLKLESSNVLESLIGIVAPEVESTQKMDRVGALSPLVDSSMVQTLKKGDMVVRKNVPSAQFVDGLEIRVQVTDAEIKSAEETIETVLEVSSTDVNDHETLVQQVNAEIESAEANVDAVFEVVSTDVNHHETLVQQVNTEIESAEAHVETTLELGSTDDHEITVQVADAEIKSAQVIIENVLEVGLTDVTDHEIKVQEMDVVIESSEAIVDAVFVVLTDVKGHEIQVQVTDANAEIGTAEAILETALEVVSSNDVMEVIDICDKMEDKGEVCLLSTCTSLNTITLVAMLLY
uniref:A kinase-anchoring proteins AKAP-5 and AKAP-12 calmodulin (CaM)-binding domain-containing protein n=1 Tax=Oncorhynchus mykiss TaxID=8022 RepID=A0A8K9USZ3_ONCMY